MLATTQAQSPDLRDIDLVPVGLGLAYRLSCEGRAMLVPGVAELVALGAPEDAQPLGQELPLFMCPEMTSESEDGPVVPLFMCFTDCADAVEASVDPRDDPKQITGLPLGGVVEQQLVDPLAGPNFSFVPPSASLAHVEAYLGQGVYWRPAED